VGMELIGRRLPGTELKAVLAGPETVEALLLGELRRFYRTAAGNGQAVLLMIT
jgi:hypothetical protein